MRDTNTIPSWLDTPPTQKVNLPVETRIQELPFHDLSWPDFEKLCLRLARLEANVEHCQLYGTPGQEQEGIDIYARQKFDEKYRVYQCKRVKDFGPSKIRDAVEKFVEGSWIDKTNTFVLCTSESLDPTDRSDEFEAQVKILKDKGVSLIPWDSKVLSLKLKDFPKIVDDFFGRAWVGAFCGKDTAEKLGKRLDKGQVIEFRKNLSAFYKSVFNTHDPGLPVTTNTLTSLPLEDRYVVPDIYDKRSITVSKDVETKSQQQPVYEDAWNLDNYSNYKHRERRHRPQYQAVSYQQRSSIEKWLASESRSIVLGGPGSGKSTLLRFLAIDLLRESPKLPLIAQKWGEYLPIWVPFAYWTKTISNHSTADYSLSQMLLAWLRSLNEERLYHLFKKALEDERVLLLVDGLDEWTTEASARIALDRLHIFIGQRNIPVILTSRPHGFARLGFQQAGWLIGELSDFSFDQQKELATNWFTCRLLSLEPGFAQGELQRKAEIEANGFINELKKSADLKELAKVPLLLCLLIYLKFQQVRLPQNRFNAYEQLIDRLISEHPKRRRTAAGITDELTGLTDNDLKKVFSNLAYHIQERGEGVIESDAAIKVIEDHLRDAEQGLGLELPEARKLSKGILQLAEDTIGLTVKKSQTEIGFFHRAFQEYLAACYLSRKPLSDHRGMHLTPVDTICRCKAAMPYTIYGGFPE